MKKIAIAILLSVVAAPAVAADTGFYAGVKIGSSTKSIGGSSESNSAVGVFGGFSINPNLAVEVGYTDLGSGGSGAVKFSALDVSAIGTFPINQQFALYGKLGMASTKEDGFGFSETRTAATYGLGGQLNINPNIGVRFGWEHYGFGDGVIFNQGDISLVSVAGVFKF